MYMQGDINGLRVQKMTQLQALAHESYYASCSLDFTLPLIFFFLLYLEDISNVSPSKSSSTWSPKLPNKQNSHIKHQHTIDKLPILKSDLPLSPSV